MKTIFFAYFLLICSTALQAQSIENFANPEILRTEVILDTTSSLQSLESLALLTPLNEYSPDRLTARVQVTSIQYNKLPLRYDANEDILPSVRNYYGQPVLDFNVFNQLESTYRVNNLAFYEANRNSVMGLQFSNGICINPL